MTGANGTLPRLALDDDGEWFPQRRKDPVSDQVDSSIVLCACAEEGEAKAHEGECGRVLIVGAYVVRFERREGPAICVFDKGRERIMLFVSLGDDQPREIDGRSILGGRGRNSAGDETLRRSSGVPGKKRCASEP